MLGFSHTFETPTLAVSAPPEFPCFSTWPRLEFKTRMDSRFLTDKDIQDVTGKKRPSAQLAWFKQCYGFAPQQRADGQIILLWATFEALQARLAGVTQIGDAQFPPAKARPALAQIRRSR